MKDKTELVALRWSVGTLLLLFYGTLCLQPSSAEARKVVDMVGQQLIIPDSPKRVLALAPSLTEMIYSLGAEQKLVGATRFSNFPPAADKLPRVGSYIQLDLERIVALRPDLCLAIKDGNPKHSIDALKALGIPIFAVDPRSIGQVFETFRVLGDMLSAEQQAQHLVADLKQRLARVANRIDATQERPTLFFQISDKPLMSAGKNSFIDQLITLAGGTNVAGGVDGYPRYSMEDIMILQPEVVVVSSMAGSISTEQIKAIWHHWPEIPAVRHNRVYVVNADLFNRPTARLIDGLEILAGLLHPDTSGVTSAE